MKGNDGKKILQYHDKPGNNTGPHKSIIAEGVICNGKTDISQIPMKGGLNKRSQGPLPDPPK